MLAFFRAFQWGKNIEHYLSILVAFPRKVTTVFVDTRLWKTKHPRKRFQNFRQSCVLLTDRIEIHQSQPDNMTSRRLEGHISGCNWWISIRSLNNMQDWWKFWKRLGGGFVFKSRVSTKAVVTWLPQNIEENKLRENENLTYPHHLSMTERGQRINRPTDHYIPCC